MPHRERCHGGVGGIKPAIEQAEACASEVFLEPDAYLHKACIACWEIPRRAAAGQDGVGAAGIAHVEDAPLGIIGMRDERG